MSVNWNIPRWTVAFKPGDLIARRPRDSQQPGTLMFVICVNTQPQIKDRMMLLVFCNDCVLEVAHNENVWEYMLITPSEPCPS